jgi:hypothetical protein
MRKVCGGPAAPLFRNPADKRAYATALRRGYLVCPSDRTRLPGAWLAACRRACVPCVLVRPWQGGALVEAYAWPDRLSAPADARMQEAVRASACPGGWFGWTDGAYYHVLVRRGPGAELVAAFLLEVLAEAAEGGEA